ncbi:hypothetical protein PR048_023432 [Dryococelus australis]|uniref:Uncharacterized protein n=1 Tax=Dryococelus australis TaxID=614101 RepID=A0ABQ9GU36_9NEOP|nr:hypothetical protein PR048_023432 [Dryococelus australis]
MKCFEMITEHMQRRRLTPLLDLPDKDTQDLHLQRLITAWKVKVRRPRKSDGESKEREASFQYHVVCGREYIRVCHSAFLSRHAVNQKRVFRLTKLLLLGQSPLCQRGKNPKTRYSGKEIKYFDFRLNITQMNELYLQKHLDSAIKYNSYREYFTQNFNYRFEHSQVDVCCKCELPKTKLKSPHISDSIEQAAEEHIGALIFDQMQNLPLGSISLQEGFCIICVNCFCVYKPKSRHSVMCMYHEDGGHNGVNEA